MHDGKLYLSLDDAIALALENNLDIAIARYNLNIADTDILRAQCGRHDSRREYRHCAEHPGRRRGRHWGARSAPATGGTSTGRRRRRRRRGRLGQFHSGAGTGDQQFRSDPYRHSARGPFQSTGHQHFSGRASGFQSGAKHRHGEFRLRTRPSSGARTCPWALTTPAAPPTVSFPA